MKFDSADDLHWKYVWWKVVVSFVWQWVVAVHEQFVTSLQQDKIEKLS